MNLIAVKSKHLLWAFLLIISHYQIYGQQLLNLDFEMKSVEHPVRPWGWEYYLHPTTTTRMDSLVKDSGKYSLFLLSENSEDSTKQVAQFYLEPLELAGQNIALTGKVKTEKLTGKGKVAISQEDDQLLTISNSFEGTIDWTSFELTTKVPDTCSAVNIDLIFSGSGKIWFDNLQLSVNGESKIALEVKAPFTKDNIKWFEERVSVLKSVDADNDDFSDLEALQKSFQDTKIIAMGESTHGTSEFFRLKHRMLAYCVENLGVRVFAMEGNMLTVENINQYVLGAPGNAKESMRGIFMVWYNEEVREMIDWVRNYNLIHEGDEIAFVGYDIQEITQPIDSLLSFLFEMDPILLAQVEKALTDLRANGSQYYYVSDSVKEAWLRDANLVYELVQKSSQNWSVEDRTKLIWGFQYANLIRQFANNLHKGHLSFYRDEAMAENIIWFMEELYPQKRMMVWAHDYHISRGDHPDNQLNIYNGLSMGRYLSNKYGNQYKAFAINTYEGAYRGMVSYSNFKQIGCPLYPAPEGTLDHALHELTLQRGSIGLFLDLAGARNEKWFTGPQPLRFANHVNIEYGYWTRYSIPFQFDGLFFIDRTSPAKTLK